MITDRRGVPDLVKACLKASPFVETIILREKDWSFEDTTHFLKKYHQGWEALALAETLEPPLSKPHLILNWNGTFDPSPLPIQGLHLGADLAAELSSGLREGKELLNKPHWKIGASVHNQKEWEALNSLPLDYVILSNIFETSCKPEKEGLGLEGTAALLCTIRTDCPFLKAYGLGGLKIEDREALTALGLQGIALRSAFF